MLSNSRAVCFLALVLAAGFALGADEQTPQASLGNLDNSLILKAKGGDRQAQFLLGYRCDQEKKYAEAFQWYGKAAHQGYAPAQSALGSMYQMGRGIPQNFGEAIKWYTQAVAQDDAVAENNLGLMYARGQGIRADLAEATKLFEKSAEQGWAAGQANLAFLRATSSPKDPVEAYSWCALALAGGQGTCNGIMQTVIPAMRDADIATANERALAWFKGKAAALKAVQPLLASAQSELALRLGTMYLQGTGLRRDDAVAVQWYRLAAESGNTAAEARLGELYYLGRGVAKDDSQAFDWFQKSAQSGDTSGQRDLGLAYLVGIGVDKDERKAVEWTRKSADRGNAEAQGLLAYCYQNGLGVPQDEQQAIRLYQQSVKNGNVAALNNSAWILATSKDKALRNPSKAVEYATAAVELSREGNPEVLDTLAEAYYDQGDYDHAIQTEEKAVALRPNGSAFKERLEKFEKAKEKHSQR